MSNAESAGNRPMTPEAPRPEPSPASPGSALRKAFVGGRGLRAGWRLLLFYALTFMLAFPGALWMRKTFDIGDTTPFTVNLAIVAELLYLAATLIAMAVMARLEHRSFADYAVPLRRAFGGRFWEGAAWGAGTIGLVALLLAACGGYAVAGINSSPEVWRAMGLWLLAALLIGVTEEVSFRGYQLATMTDGLGFWIAAILQSLYFGWILHYLEKPNETVLDGINVSLIAFFFCYAVRRTGDIWFATGWHFTFNFTSFFVLGSPNTAFGGPVEPHLLRSSFPGPDWLTGGPTGLEASAIGTAVFALLFWAVQLRFRRAAAPAAR